MPGCLRGTRLATLLGSPVARRRDRLPYRRWRPLRTGASAADHDPRAMAAVCAPGRPSHDLGPGDATVSGNTGHRDQAGERVPEERPAASESVDANRDGIAIPVRGVGAADEVGRRRLDGGDRDDRGLHGSDGGVAVLSGDAVKFFGIVTTFADRVWMVKATSESEATIEALKLNGIVIREAQ